MITTAAPVRSRGGRAALLAAVLLVALASGVGETGAAFSSVTSNGGNSFAAAGCASVAVTATSDAWIRSDATSDNAGTATQISVRSQIGQNRRSLVSFPLPTTPPGCTLLSATLRLDASTSATGRTIQAYQLAATWAETGVTWANQPDATGTPATTPSATGWVEFDTTTIVQAQYAGTNHGFLIRDGAEDDASAQQHVYSSREGANPPQLVLTFG